jgi:hypothetical protein
MRKKHTRRRLSYQCFHSHQRCRHIPLVYSIYSNSSAYIQGSPSGIDLSQPTSYNFHGYRCIWLKNYWFVLISFAKWALGLEMIMVRWASCIQANKITLRQSALTVAWIHCKSKCLSKHKTKQKYAQFFKHLNAFIIRFCVAFIFCL